MYLCFLIGIKYAAVNKPIDLEYGGAECAMPGQSVTLSDSWENIRIGLF